MYVSLAHLAPQTSRHARGEEPHRASAGRHLCPGPHPESPQLCPHGTHDHVYFMLESFSFVSLGDKGNERTYLL